MRVRVASSHVADHFSLRREGHTHPHHGLWRCRRAAELGPTEPKCAIVHAACVPTSTPTLQLIELCD